MKVQIHKILVQRGQGLKPLPVLKQLKSNSVKKLPSQQTSIKVVAGVGTS
jgi:hypothetical protein